MVASAKSTEEKLLLKPREAAARLSISDATALGSDASARSDPMCSDWLMRSVRTGRTESFDRSE